MGLPRLSIEHVAYSASRGLGFYPTYGLDVARGAVLTEDERAERARIVAALAASAGNTIKAASTLGLSRRQLIEKFERYRIPRPPKPAPTEETRAELARILAELESEKAE